MLKNKATNLSKLGTCKITDHLFWIKVKNELLFIFIIIGVQVRRQKPDLNIQNPQLQSYIDGHNRTYLDKFQICQ